MIWRRVLRELWSQVEPRAAQPFRKPDILCGKQGRWQGVSQNERPNHMADRQCIQRPDCKYRIHFLSENCWNFGKRSFSIRKRIGGNYSFNHRRRRQQRWRRKLSNFKVGSTDTCTATTSNTGYSYIYWIPYNIKYDYTTQKQRICIGKSALKEIIQIKI